MGWISFIGCLRERRELGGANQWRDVEIEVLPVVDQGGALHAGSFPAREPQPAGLRDGDGSPRAGAKSRRDRTGQAPTRPAVTISVPITVPVDLTGF